MVRNFSATNISACNKCGFPDEEANDISMFTPTPVKNCGYLKLNTTVGKQTRKVN
jgi:hypothetical protein